MISDYQFMFPAWEIMIGNPSPLPMKGHILQLLGEKWQLGRKYGGDVILHF